MAQLWNMYGAQTPTIIDSNEVPPNALHNLLIYLVLPNQP